MTRFLSFFFLCTVSGLLAILAFPPSEAWFLVWIGFVPILIFIDQGKSSTHRFIAGFFAGFSFYAVALYWISSVAGFFYLFIAGYLAFFWGLFFWVFFSFPSKVRIIYGISLWYFTEIIIQYLFTGFPWLPLSLSQWSFPATARIVSITGTSGLSALIIGVNLCFYSLIKEKNFLPLVISVIVVSMLIYASSFTVSSMSNGKYLKIVAIQGNTGYFGQIPEESFEKYYELTDTISENPDLVIWPESSYPSILTDNKVVFNTLINKSHNFPILIGTFDKTEDNIYNSAFLFNKGSFTRYEKNHLVPFGEYVPGKNFKFVNKLYQKFAGQVPDLKSGKYPGVFNLNSYNFSVLICFENIFPYLAQKSIKYNPSFFITITNDSWYGNSSGPYQHFAHNIFRAIETGRTVIQVSTTGITGFSTPNGNIRMLEKNGQHLMMDGIMEIELPEIIPNSSIYAQIGETGISLAFLILIGICLCRY